MRNRIRLFLVNLIAKHVFKVILEEDLLRRNERGRLEVRGNELTPEGAELIANQAQALKDSMLWRHLRNDLQYHALKKTLNDSQSMNDVISGKLTLYLIDVIESRVDNLSKGK